MKDKDLKEFFKEIRAAIIVGLLLIMLFTYLGVETDIKIFVSEFPFGYAIYWWAYLVCHIPFAEDKIESTELVFDMVLAVFLAKFMAELVPWDGSIPMGGYFLAGFIISVIYSALLRLIVIPAKESIIQAWKTWFKKK